jgi:hypothetical protein
VKDPNASPLWAKWLIWIVYCGWPIIIVAGMILYWHFN